MNGGIKAPTPYCVFVAAVVDTVEGAVTHKSVETGITIIASMAVDTLAPTVGVDACMDCAFEEDCDDVEVPLLVGRAIFLRLYHFLNACTNKYFSRKQFTKDSSNFQKKIHKNTLENI